MLKMFNLYRATPSELLVTIIHLLVAKLDLNSSNSSIPPSQDPCRKRGSKPKTKASKPETAKPEPEAEATTPEPNAEVPATKLSAGV